MTENNRNTNRTARQLFARASELPESNFEARTLAQKLDAETEAGE